MFFFSLETLATVGYGVMAPATLYGHSSRAPRSSTGVIFTAIMTGLLFVRFSKPKARISYADNPVVTVHDGRPTLMLRIGNARSSILTNARFTLHALVPVVSDEGRATRSLVELPMVRAQLPIFAILWTMMHVIDEDSVLHGLDAAAVIAARNPLLRYDRGARPRHRPGDLGRQDLHGRGPPVRDALCRCHRASAPTSAQPPITP